MHTRLIIAATASLLTVACGGGAPEDGPVAGGGEVLEGTASDAMLPLATVTSQPPLAPPEPETSTRAPVAGPTPEPTPTAEPSATATDTATD